MSTLVHVSVDAFGRLTIPEEIRRRVGLSTGSSVSIEAVSDHEIRLVSYPGAGVEERDGLPVITAVPETDLLDAVDADRESRMQELLNGVREP